MPWKTKYDPENDFVMIICDGENDFEDYKDQAESAFSLLKKHNASRVFVDDRKLINKATPEEIYFLKDYYSEVGIDSSVSIALLVSNERGISEQFEFYENIMRNHGFNLKLFLDKEKAMKWLKA